MLSGIYKTGDPIELEFDGETVRGTVEETSNGKIVARLLCEDGPARITLLKSDNSATDSWYVDEVDITPR